jgi:hypothetical protein
MYYYLCCRRVIDGEIVNTLIRKGMLYENRRGSPRFDDVRGTHDSRAFRMNFTACQIFRNAENCTQQKLGLKAKAIRE